MVDTSEHLSSSVYTNNNFAARVFDPFYTLISSIKLNLISSIRNCHAVESVVRVYIVSPSYDWLNNPRTN